jgi:preprotein translocase subunit SecE
MQVRNLTLMVVAVSAVMGFLLGGMDWLSSRFAALIIGPA